MAQLGNKGFGDPLTFDNQYYTRAFFRSRGRIPQTAWPNMIGLPSDHVLPDDSMCRPSIEAYAGDQQHFFSRTLVQHMQS